MNLKMYQRNTTTSPALHMHAEDRLHAALARIVERIGFVNVRVSDINGPRGGMDKRCDLRVQILGGDTVTIRETDSCLYRAIDRAAGRLKRIALRKLDRRKTRQRRKIRRAMR